LRPMTGAEFANAIGMSLWTFERDLLQGFPLGKRIRA
jgi:hypothetical protein